MTDWFLFFSIPSSLFYFYFWMTSNENYYNEERYGRRNRNDGHTSDDSLLMADDNTPLLNGINNGHVIRKENLLQQSLSTSTHCHVPDDAFDYGARNRLVLVLFICIIFMGIEIAGMFLGYR